MLAGRSQPAAQHNISSRWFLSSASRKGVMQVARLPVLQPRCADLPQKADERGRERKKEHNSPPLSSRASQGYTRDTNACVQQVVYVCARAARERKERRRREKRQAQFFPREVQEWERQIIWGISGIEGAQLHIAHKGLPWPRIHARSRSLSLDGEFQFCRRAPRWTRRIDVTHIFVLSSFFALIGFRTSLLRFFPSCN